MITKVQRDDPLQVRLNAQLLNVKEVMPVEFFVMSTDHRRNVCVMEAAREQEYDPWKLFRGEWQPDRPLQFCHAFGRSPRDILDTTDAVTRIVSERVLALLRAHGVTGWATYPVTVHDRHGHPLPGYTGLSVVGRSGPVDDREQRIEVRQSPHNPDYQYRVGIGLPIDPCTWDGSDIFTPQGGMVLVVDAVRTLMLDAHIKELQFTPTSAYEESLGPA